MIYNNEPEKSDDLPEEENTISVVNEDVNDFIEPDKPKDDTTHTLKTRTCPYCKQQVHIKVGVGNWKNLFRKPTPEDWISLFILLMLVTAAYAYTNETKQCRETLTNLGTVCLDYNKMMSNYTGNYTPPNFVFNPITNDSKAYRRGER